MPVKILMLGLLNIRRAEESDNRLSKSIPTRLSGRHTLTLSSTTTGTSTGWRWSITDIAVRICHLLLELIFPICWTVTHVQFWFVSFYFLRQRRTICRLTIPKRKRRTSRAAEWMAFTSSLKSICTGAVTLLKVANISSIPKGSAFDYSSD